MAIFAEITDELSAGGCIWAAEYIAILLSQYYFQIQLQVWFYHDEIFVNFRLSYSVIFVFCIVRVRCRRKNVHVRYLIFWWVSCWTEQYHTTT